MQFVEIYDELMNGKKIRRAEWDKNLYLELNNNGEVKCYTMQVTPYIYNLSILMSKEWLVVGEEEILNFIDALKALKMRKKVKNSSWNDEYLLADPYSKSLSFHQKCELNFVPTYECFISHDWEVIN